MQQVSIGLECLAEHIGGLEPQVIAKADGAERLA